VFFLSTLAGGLSAARFDPAYERLGLLGEARVWFLVALFGILGCCGLVRGRSAPRSPDGVAGWTITVVVLHVYLACSALWAPDPLAAWSQVADLILLILLLIVTLRVFSNVPAPNVELFLRLFFWTSLLLLVGAVPSYLADLGELSSLATGAIGLSRTAATGALVAVYFWVKTGRVRWLMAFTPLVLGVLFSGSRNVALALVFATLLFLVTARKRLGPRALRVGLVGVAAIAGVGLALIPALVDNLFRFWASLAIVGADRVTLETLYVADRDILFGEAWRLFGEAPTLGIGLSGYTQVTGEVYPHNLVLNIAAEGGIVGLVLLLPPLVLLVMRWPLPKDLHHLVALSLGTLYLVASMFAGSYYDARLAWVFFTLYMMPAQRSPEVAKA
jgi:O-antigen ligase